MGKHLEQALPSVYTLQCLTGKVDNNNNIHIIIHIHTHKCVCMHIHNLPHIYTHNHLIVV